MGIKLAPTPQVIQINDVPKEGGLRAAVRLLDKGVTHGTRDDVITDLEASDAFKAFEAAQHPPSLGEKLRIHRNPYRKLSTFDTELIQSKLPEIQALFRSVEKDAGRQGAFCSAFTVSGVRDLQVRECAQVIAELGCKSTGMPYLNNDSQVNLRDLDKAVALIAAGQVPQGVSDKVFNAENVGRIQRFMETGEEDLVTLYDVSINGRVFPHAFPITDMALTAGQTPEDQAKEVNLIRQLDRRFEKSGFDRIYIRGPENTLYVVPNLGDLRTTVGMRMQPRHGDGAWQDTGQVIAVKNANNSLKEATVKLWADVATGFSSMFTTLFRKDKGLETVYDNQETSGDTKVPVGEGLLNAKTGTVAIFASLAVGGAAVVDPMSAAQVLGAAAILVQGTSISAAIRNRARATLNPYFHAAGVAVNRDEKLR